MGKLLGISVAHLVGLELLVSCNFLAVVHLNASHITPRTLHRANLVTLIQSPANECRTTSDSVEPTVTALDYKGKS